MKHLLQILDSTGHTTVEFDPAVESEVGAARDKFDQYVRAHGYTAFRTTAPVVDSPNAPIVSLGTLREFDPAAETVLLVPRTEGG